MKNGIKLWEIQTRNSKMEYFTDLNQIFSEENRRKSIHVLYSGGCDSTLLLHALLHTLKSKNDEREVSTYSFSHFQLDQWKSEREQNARTEFLSYCKKNDLRHNIHKNIDINTRTIEGENIVRCPQPAMWLTNIIPILPEKSILFCGYIHGDDFFSYDVYYEVKKLVDSLSWLYGKDILFGFPLKDTGKYDILKQLFEANLYDMTWHCERPLSNYKECHRCDPCIKHDAYKTLIEYEKKKSELLHGTFKIPVINEDLKPLEDKLISTLGGS